MKKKYIKIGNRKIGPEYQPVVIAEIGINYNGKLGNAMKINDI